MVWTIILMIVACALLCVAGYLVKVFEKDNDGDTAIWAAILIVVAIIIIGLYSWLGLYNKGLKRGYPTALKNIPKEQIYKFLEQVQGSKKLVVVLEDAEGKIRCVNVAEPIDPNTEYLKRVTDEVEEKVVTKIIKKKHYLRPAAKETNKD